MKQTDRGTGGAGVSHLSEQTQAALQRCGIGRESWHTLDAELAANDVIRHWLDVGRSGGLCNPAGALVKRLQGRNGLPDVPPTMTEVCKAIDDRLILSINGSGVPPGKATWNIGGVRIDDKYILTKSEIEMAVLA